ncbi:hypothetical protein [Micromonospora wenchangensis]|uniref:hypothetical protein n=1 Tax=Micromonospora wenchangensis TaxID=1185415 RepID=UPI00342AE4CC
MRSELITSLPTTYAPGPAARARPTLLATALPRSPAAPCTPGDATIDTKLTIFSSFS